MAEAFLNQLLRVENSVQPNNSGECCVICLTEYGTLCPKTGVVEWEIRMPCNHHVGSSCIATWLDPTGAAKNSCPLCRNIFFPAQPRPYLEHGIFEGNQNDGINSRESRLPARIARMDFEHDRRSFIDIMFGVYGDEDAYEEVNSAGISPVPPVTSEHSPPPGGLRRSARLRGIAPEYLEQESTPIPSAPRQEGVSQHDGRELRSEDSEDEEEFDMTTLRIMCETYSYRLNLALTPSSRAIEISQRIAERTIAAHRTSGYSLQSCAAVAVYLASHLTGAPKTPHAVSMMSGVDSRIISAVCWPVYSVRVRAALLDEDMLAMINRGDRETVLGLMPGPSFPD